MGWIEHVKQYAKTHNVSYKQAMSDAKESYVKKNNVKKSDERTDLEEAKNYIKKHNLNLASIAKKAKKYEREG